MLKRILVAVDLDETNTDVLQRAIALAKALEADLRLVSVFDSEEDSALLPYTYPGIVGYPILDESIWQDYQERYQKEKNEHLTKLIQLSRQVSHEGVKNEYTQKVDSPGRAICELAQSWKADLVIVGSHGRKGLSELFLGSVSNYVMHHVSCSVMVVHPAKTAESKVPELVA